MMKTAPDSAADTRLHVGVLGLVPMRAVGLQALFQDHPVILIVQADILELLRDTSLRVLILGARSTASLFKLMATAKAYRPDLRVIVMAPSWDEEAILKVVAVGAKGYLRDTSTAKEVQQAIQIVAAGSLWAPRRVLSLLIERMTSAAAPTGVATSLFLTKREREVLELLVAGRPNREIAKTLRIGEPTVKGHVGKLMRKVGVTSRTALTMHAVTNALLDTTPPAR